MMLVPLLLCRLYLALQSCSLAHRNLLLPRNSLFSSSYSLFGDVSFTRIIQFNAELSYISSTGMSRPISQLLLATFSANVLQSIESEKKI